MDVKRLKMWTCIFLFCFLGLGFKVSALGNFTQVYYLVLRTEESAIQLIEPELRKFSMSLNDSFVVKDPAFTTTCVEVNNQMVCQCKTQYKWSDKLCNSQPACCRDPLACTFKTLPTPVPMCIPTTRVVVTGFFKTQSQYNKDLSDSKSTLYQTMSNDLYPKMLSVYSTFPKFDSLTILRFRSLSIFKHFFSRAI